MSTGVDPHQQVRRDDAPLSMRAARMLFEHAAAAFAVTEGDTHRTTYVNPAFRSLTGFDDASLDLPFASVCDTPALQRLLDLARHERRCVSEEIAFQAAGSDPWCFRVWPIEDDSGAHTGAVVQMTSLESANPRFKLQREIAERLLLGALREMDAAAEAYAAQERTQFLADAGRDLAASVDETVTRASVSALRMPGACTWCIVDVVETDGSLRRLAIVHPDESSRNAARALESSWRPRPDDPFGAPAIAHDRRPVSITQDVASIMERTAADDATIAALRQLHIGSLLTVPMEVRDTLLGAITFVGATARAAFSAEEIELAEALALRGAVALDIARMYGAALELKEQALDGSRAKSEFLARMSHELRTPLNAIAGFVDIIDMEIHGPVTRHQRSDLARIRASQEHLLFMINDILNYMTIRRAGADYHPAELPLRETVQRALDLTEALVAEKGLTLEEQRCPADVWLRADPDRTHQVLVNLLANAVKYTPGGGRVGVECHVAEETVHVTIWDSGIGVAADRLESIFEPFVQEISGYADRDGGVGLGLAISRDLARAMGGNVTVESTLGAGSRFTLWLRAAES